MRSDSEGTTDRTTITAARARPAHPQPGSSERAGPPVCYVCGAPASDECRQCRRPACDEHQVPLAKELQSLFGPDACPECARLTADDLARDEGQWARKRERDRTHRTCALCHREFEQVLPQCSHCDRHLCPEHSTRYRKRFRFGARDGVEAAWYWDHEARCPDHRMNPLLARLRGWEENPSSEDLMPQ